MDSIVIKARDFAAEYFPKHFDGVTSFGVCEFSCEYYLNISGVDLEGRKFFVKSSLSYLDGGYCDGRVTLEFS